MKHSAIEQHDAQKLATGYSKWFRAVEVSSIITFWLLTAGIVYRVSGHFHESPWLILAATLSGFIAADFASGFVHWLGDTWGALDTPILGKAFIRPFREHHVDERAITRHDYIETNGANCLISVPVAAGAVLLPLDSHSSWHWLTLFTTTSVGSMIFWVMMTNQFHKWAHNTDDERPQWVTALQRLHLVLPPAHHQIHHKAPFAKYYCITTGWLNWSLTKLRFFPLSERLISAVTGAIPRRDDIGERAALAIAAVPVVGSGAGAGEKTVAVPSTGAQ